MIVHSKQYFTTRLDDKQVQPNAVDIRVDKLFEFSVSVQYLSEDKALCVPRQQVELIPEQIDGLVLPGWVLPPGSYQFESSSIVQVPAEIVGWVVARSTLNRNGVFVTSGLYDSGYHGPVGGALHVLGGPLVLEHNARIAQFITVQGEYNHMYDGQYNISNV